MREGRRTDGLDLGDDKSRNAGEIAIRAGT